MAKILEIHGLKKVFQGREVLNVDELTFHEGKSYALLGENGSGKSTLIRVLAGIISPNAGQIQNPWEVAYIPQKPYAFHMPVWKSVTLGITADKDKPRREAAKEVLEEVGAAGLALSIESRLSGGEGQRVSFARILLRPRKLLLLDEPTSAIDKEGTELLEASLKKYQKNYGATIIFATHSLLQALRLADSAVLLQKGRVAMSGPVEQVVSVYRSE